MKWRKFSEGKWAEERCAQARLQANPAPVERTVRWGGHKVAHVSHRAQGLAPRERPLEVSSQVTFTEKVEQSSDAVLDAAGRWTLLWAGMR